MWPYPVEIAVQPNIHPSFDPKQTVRLHNAIKYLGRRESSMHEQAAQEIECALEAGADPNGLNRGGLTPFNHLCTINNYIRLGAKRGPYFDKILKLLVERGANPFLADCKLLEKSSYEVCQALILIMHTAEKSGTAFAPLCAPQTPFHIFASKRPSVLSALFGWSPNKENPYGSAPVDWIDRVRPLDNETPLGALWSEFKIRDDERLRDFDIGQRSRLTALLLRAGANPFHRNAAGDMPASAIIDAYKEGSTFPRTLYDQVRAGYEAIELGQATPAPRGATSRRL